MLNYLIPHTRIKPPIKFAGRLKHPYFDFGSMYEQLNGVWVGYNKKNNLFYIEYLERVKFNDFYLAVLTKEEFSYFILTGEWGPRND